MTDEFRRALIAEQFGAVTRQWHPSVGELLAAGERVLHVEGHTENSAEEVA